MQPWWAEILLTTVCFNDMVHIDKCSEKSWYLCQDIKTYCKVFLYRLALTITLSFQSLNSSQTTAFFSLLCFTSLERLIRCTIIVLLCKFKIKFPLMTHIRLYCFALEKRQMRTADTFDKSRCGNCIHPWQQYSQRNKILLQILLCQIIILVLFRRECF